MTRKSVYKREYSHHQTPDISQSYLPLSTPPFHLHSLFQTIKMVQAKFIISATFALGAWALPQGTVENTKRCTFNDGVGDVG